MPARSFISALAICFQTTFLLTAASADESLRLKFPTETAKTDKPSLKVSTKVSGAAQRGIEAPAEAAVGDELRVKVTKPAGADNPDAKPSGDSAPAEVAVSAAEQGDADEDGVESASVTVKSGEEAGREVPRQLRSLRTRIAHVLEMYAPEHLNDYEHSPWEVMHAIISYGVKTKVLIGGPRGETESAIGWICYNHPFKGQRLLRLENGRLDGIKGVGLQGHHGQLLAMLAQSHLVRSYPIRVEGRSFTVDDLIESEKLTCRAGEELTFKLIALAHYEPTDVTWRSEDGQDWSIPRLLREELKQPIQGAACGGTHRLMGLSYAIRKRESEQAPMSGEYRVAKNYIDAYHEFALRLRNPDGSFSTQWLEYRQALPDLERRLQTSGHILEWLVFSLPADDLFDPDFTRSVDYVTTLLERGPQQDWKIGHLGHALHALALYERRISKALAGSGGPSVAASKAQEAGDDENAGQKQLVKRRFQ